MGSRIVGQRLLEIAISYLRACSRHPLPELRDEDVASAGGDGRDAVVLVREEEEGVAALKGVRLEIACANAQTRPKNKVSDVTESRRDGVQTPGGRVKGRGGEGEDRSGHVLSLMAG